ncbi:MAG: type II secretion system F family protein [Acetivibrionales bacterium]|nr:pilus assembly protein TadB [Clostridiaceae bacterium]
MKKENVISIKNYITSKPAEAVLPFSNEKNVNLPQYQVYVMKPDELALTLLLAMGVFFAIGMLFYENVVLSAIFSLAGFSYIPIRKRELLRKKKEDLSLQFKDMLYFLSVSLSVGKSFETALIETQKSMAVIYPDNSCDIMLEIEIMNQRVLMNEPVEKAFYDLALRSEIEDIKNFADVIMISKRAGVNLVEVIKNSTEIIREKIEMRQEIDNLLAAKKLENKILSVMPFAMVIMLKETGSGFMDPLMTTLYGRVVMTIALILVFSGLIIARKIMDIEV